MTVDYRVVKKYPDGSFFSFAKGAFDNWQVRYTNSEGKQNSPKDIDYLTKLKQLVCALSSSTKADLPTAITIVRNDFVTIYHLVYQNAINQSGNPINQESDFNKIASLSQKYSEVLKTEKLFGVLYLAMISEWHYTIPNSIPKTRSYYRHTLKALAVMQVLRGGMDPSEAADWSRNKHKSKTPQEKMSEMGKYKIDYKKIMDVKIDDTKEQYPLS